LILGGKSVSSVIPASLSANRQDIGLSMSSERRSMVTNGYKTIANGLAKTDRNDAISLRGFLWFFFFSLVLLWFLFVMSAFVSHNFLLLQQHLRLFTKV
jgi:hypothetical protein